MQRPLHPHLTDETQLRGLLQWEDLSSFAPLGCPHPAPAALKPLQRATPHTCNSSHTQLLTHVKFSSSWRNRFQNLKAWPVLQTDTEATHPNTTLHLKVLQEKDFSLPRLGKDNYPQDYTPGSYKAQSHPETRWKGRWQSEASTLTLFLLHHPQLREGCLVPRRCLFWLAGLPQPVLGQTRQIPAS